MKKNKNLFLIHGAWSTKSSFNYLLKYLLDNHNIAKIKCFEYDSFDERIPKIVNRAKEELSVLNENGHDTIVIGHSLGGLIALALAEEKGVVRTITLASPLNGIRLNRLFQAYLLYRAPILHDATPESSYLDRIHRIDYNNPIDVLVSCKGFNPAIYEPSDGVVTVASQVEWIPKTGKLIKVDANHHEILQTAEFLLTVERALKKE